MKNLLAVALMAVALAGCAQTTTGSVPSNCDRTNTACKNSKFHIQAIKLPPTP